MTFHKLDLDYQKRFREYLKKCPQVTSDYTFLNLWGWQGVYNLSFWFEEDLIFIKEGDDSTFWGPIGDWKKIKWKEYASFLKGKVFVRVPEVLVDIWIKDFGEHMKVTEDRDQWDYIYSVKELIQLKGNKFHKKKNLLRQFEKKYEYKFVNLESKWIIEAESFQVDWCFYKDCENKDILINENMVILNVLDNWDKLEGVLGGGLVVDNKIIAYTIAEPIDDRMLVIHFEKGCPTYKGVYQAINNIFLKMCAKDFKYVNREQDLGDKGLRQAKLSYNPCCFLKKYRVNFL